MTTETTIQITRDVSIEEDALAARTEASKVKVTDDDSFALAGEILKRLAEAKNRIIAHHKPIKDAINRLKDVVLDQEKALLNPVAAAIETIKQEIGRYAYEQEQARRKEQARLEGEARKQHEEIFIGAAADLEKNGAHAEAEMVLDSAIHHQPTVVLPKTAAPKGIGTGEVWDFEVIDPSNVPREFLLVDDKKLGQYARTMKESCLDKDGKSRVPGVRFFTKPKVTVRTR